MKKEDGLIRFVVRLILLFDFDVSRRDNNEVDVEIVVDIICGNGIIGGLLVGRLGRVVVVEGLYSFLVIVGIEGFLIVIVDYKYEFIY